MSKNAYADIISDSQVMVSGLRNHATEVARRGIDEAFTNSLDANRTLAAALNTEQERLKAELKTKTAELEAKLAEIDKALSEAKKVVKMEFPQTQWAEFGITDKK